MVTLATQTLTGGGDFSVARPWTLEYVLSVTGIVLTVVLSAAVAAFILRSLRGRR